MSSAVEVNKLVDWFATKKDQKSQFLCAVCGSICNRNISDEFGNLTFSTGKRQIANSAYNELETGLVWTCSERCKVTYTLQKA